MNTVPALPDARPWRYALGASGVALVALGALALLAWACGEPDYLQIDSNRPPLHYNGALVFLLWGAAYVALARGRARTARVLGAALAALGAGATVVSLAGVGVRLDSWAFAPSRNAISVGPAGMAPGLGLSAAAAGLALVLAGRRAPGPFAASVGTLTGALLVLGVPAAIGATGAAPLAGPSGGAVLGAAGVWLAGLGLIGSWFRKGAPSVVLGSALPIAVGAVGLGLTFALWLALNAEQEERIQRQVQFEAAHVQRLLTDRFPTELERVVKLAEDWPDARGDAPVPETLRMDIGNYIGMTPGCTGVARIDEAGRVQWVEHVGLAPAALEQLGGGAELTEAVRTGQTAVVRPLRSCWRGQRMLLIFAPHRAKGDRGGFVAAISVQQFYSNALNTNVAAGYAVTVTDGGELVFTRFGSPPGAGGRWNQTLPVTFRNNAWALTVAPTSDMLAREALSMPRLSLLTGVVLTALLALAVHLAQTARRRAGALETEMRERRLAEQALRHSEEKYRTLIENLGQGVFLQNAEQRYVAANGPFCASVGRSEAEVVGATEADLFDRTRAARYAEEVRTVLAGGRSVESEAEFLAGERRTWVRRVLTPVRDATDRVTGVLGICWDVTEQRRLEAHVNQASKMDAIGQLAGGIAHDFNNLLTVILGSLDVMLSDAPPDHPDRPLALAAQSAAHRAADLTQRLLGFSRRHQLDWRPTALNGVVGEVVGLLQRTIDPLIRIETDLNPELWPVESDPTLLNQVLMNLCINARDAIAGAGVIGIETGCVTREEGAGGGGEYVRLRVTDTGAGMAPEVKARMFEPFFTTKDVGKGTGLGLAMVFAIVRQHKGWIECDSEPGTGTRFDIYLPRCAPAPLSVHAPVPLAVRRAGHGTVLVVDDEELIRTLAATALRGAGYTVLQAADGRQGVDLYAQERDRIDVVLLDLTMPVLSGHEAFRLLLDLNPRVKVFLVSGYSTEQLSDLEREKMVGFLKKPYRPSELVAAVDDALRRRGARPDRPALAVG